MCILIENKKKLMSLLTYLIFAHPINLLLTEQPKALLCITFLYITRYNTLSPIKVVCKGCQVVLSQYRLRKNFS